VPANPHRTFVPTSFLIALASEIGANILPCAPQEAPWRFLTHLRAKAP
jgi:hypothetical protein